MTITAETTGRSAGKYAKKWGRGGREEKNDGTAHNAQDC